MASSTAVLRTLLSATGLVRLARCRFSAIVDPRRSPSVQFSLADTLMAALAMFPFKSPSLLHFDQLTHGPERETLLGNLQRLYRLGTAPPSDTQMYQTDLDESSNAATASVPVVDDPADVDTTPTAPIPTPTTPALNDPGDIGDTGDTGDMAGSDSSGGGCSIASTGARDPLFGLLMMLGLTGFVARRRQRRSLD